ncbi:hypothetical protein [Pseudaestuariivita rosea]|uniref:hypothetical protein n=1 Tax=Pseudaestuariivita rosea TaxID=2763263 RepID=UPI001ABAFF25|nr:hypothetical protein [Pseudaestuariivita rosea]
MRETETPIGQDAASNSRWQLHVLSLLGFFVISHLLVGGVVIDARVENGQAAFVYRDAGGAATQTPSGQLVWTDVSWFVYYLEKVTGYLLAIIVLSGLVAFVLLGGFKKVRNG